jgi:hypothetical protein
MHIKYIYSALYTYNVFYIMHVEAHLEELLAAALRSQAVPRRLQPPRRGVEPRRGARRGPLALQRQSLEGRHGGRLVPGAQRVHGRQQQPRLGPEVPGQVPGVGPPRRAQVAGAAAVEGWRVAEEEQDLPPPAAVRGRREPPQRVRRRLRRVSSRRTMS